VYSYIPVIKFWYKQMTFLSTVRKKLLEQDPEIIYPSNKEEAT